MRLWGGKLEITSTLAPAPNQGTVITLHLPLATTPSWFVSELKLPFGSTIVVLDDDPSIHAIWQDRLQALSYQDFGLKIRHFSTPSELESYVMTAENPNYTLYLNDYELLGHEKTGLDLIEELKIARQSILVTSRFEEKPVAERAEKIGLKLIPKSIASLVPIKILKVQEKVDAILLDDDELVHLTWKTIASQNDKSLLSFYRPDDFFRTIEDYDRTCPVYIDSNLGNGISGQDLVLRVSELGFSKIYLATGYDPSAFGNVLGLTAVVGKEPPNALQVLS